MISRDAFNPLDDLEIETWLDSQRLRAAGRLESGEHRLQEMSTIDPTPTWRIIVSLLIRFTPSSLTAEQYDNVVRRLTEDGVFPADGLEYEICYGSGDNLKVSQVWDSQHQLDAFAARLMPILAELGIAPGTPEVLEVHNIIKR